MVKTTYHGSKLHLENSLKGRLKSTVIMKQKKQDRINKYVKNPTLCKKCSEPLEYSKRKNKFCNHSCASSFTNRERKSRTPESLLKTSRALKGRSLSKQHRAKISNTLKGKYHGKIIDPYFHIKRKQCPECLNYFWDYSKIGTGLPVRITCSDDCRFQRIIRNSRRIKTIPYFCKEQNKMIKLDSSWEYKIAVFLDSMGIIWIRPSYICWIDDNNKDRKYFPDFYLVDLDLYLDPKNPTILKRDKRKIEIVSREIDLLVGDVQQIIIDLKNLI